MKSCYFHFYSTCFALWQRIGLSDVSEVRHIGSNTAKIEHNFAYLFQFYEDLPPETTGLLSQHNATYWFGRGIIGREELTKSIEIAVESNLSHMGDSDCIQGLVREIVVL